MNDLLIRNAATILAVERGAVGGRRVVDEGASAGLDLVELGRAARAAVRALRA